MQPHTQHNTHVHNTQHTQYKQLHKIHKKHIPVINSSLLSSTATLTSVITASNCLNGILLHHALYAAIPPIAATYPNVCGKEEQGVCEEEQGVCEKEQHTQTHKHTCMCPINAAEKPKCSVKKKNMAAPAVGSAFASTRNMVGLRTLGCFMAVHKSQHCIRKSNHRLVHVGVSVSTGVS